MAGDELEEPRASGGLVGMFLGELRGLREDVRRDNTALEERVMAVLREYRQDMTDFVLAHGRDHEQMTIERERDHGEFRQFIRNAELASARRDGALGVVRYVVELLARHAPRLATLLVPVLLFLLAALGNIRFGVTLQ